MDNSNLSNNQPMKQKKIIGALLCTFFVTFLIDYLINMLLPHLGLIQPKVFLTISAILYLIPTGVVLKIAYDKRLASYRLSRTFANVLFVFLAIIDISLFISLSFDYNIFSFLGGSAAIVLSLLKVITVACFLCSLKIWKSIKIIGSISFIPTVIINILAFAYFDKLDFDSIFIIIKIIKILGWITILLYITSIILICLWKNKKSSEIYPKCQAVDII